MSGIDFLTSISELFGIDTEYRETQRMFQDVSL